ncbi:hypothetical protein B0H16DRAFT_1811236 [Mycena metata]|uniref:Uncharacterized protein n=1 Tax=Mycena metata TaxID=1033252 RepID=A0AAD7JCC6_9AGAR|nr:hypothetical protein B0H16DRAFT_1811236 [Mycena metata]
MHVRAKWFVLTGVQIRAILSSSSHPFVLPSSTQTRYPSALLHCLPGSGFALTVSTSRGKGLAAGTSTLSFETKEGAAAGNARICGAQSLLRLLGLNPVHVRGRDRQGDKRTCTVQLRAIMGSFYYRLVSSILGVLLNCSSCAPRNVAQHPGIVLNPFSNFSSCLAATLNTDFNLVSPTVGWNNHQAATSNEVRPVALSQITLRRRSSSTPPNAVKIQPPQLAHEPTHNHSPRGARAFGLRLVVYPAKSQSNSPSQVTNSRVLELATFCCFNQDSSELQSPLKLPASAILVKSAPQLSPSTLTTFNTLQINKSSSNQVRNASSET